MREDRQRLDKWLWFARFAKTRSLAARLIEDGYVRVNGQRADAPSKALAVGDVVTVAAQHVTAAVRVRDLGCAGARRPRRGGSIRTCPRIPETTRRAGRSPAEPAEARKRDGKATPGGNATSPATVRLASPPGRV